MEPNASGTGSGDFRLAASHNVAEGHYSVISTNVAASSQALNLDLNSLGIPQGSRVVIEEVSSVSHGEVHSGGSLLLTNTMIRRLPSIAQRHHVDYAFP